MNVWTENVVYLFTVEFMDSVLYSCKYTAVFALGHFVYTAGST